jgi:predicted enzyme related to lactoylglutathione lyase
MKLIVLALASLALTNAQNSKGPVSPMASNPNMPSKISMIMLGVENVARSVAFYRDVVGLELQSQSSEFAFFSTGSVTLALNLPLGLHMQPRAGATEIIFPVESVSTAQALLKERGCSFLNEPREVTPGSWAVNFKDPDGHHLTLLGSK